MGRMIVIMTVRYFFNMKDEIANLHTVVRLRQLTKVSESRQDEADESIRWRER